MDCQCLLMFSAFLMLMTTNNALMYILKMLIFLYFVKVSHFTLKKIHMCKLESYTQILSSHWIHLYNILLHVWWPMSSASALSTTEAKSDIYHSRSHDRHDSVLYSVAVSPSCTPS